MSNEDQRLHRESASYKVDYSKPIDKETKMKIIEAEEKKEFSCFGVAWSPAAQECSLCADSEICCIFHRDLITKQAKAVEKKSGVLFLDKADFSRIDTEQLLFQIDLHSGSMTTQDLISIVSKAAHMSDEVAVVQWIKRFKEETGKFKIKQGFIHFVK